MLEKKDQETEEGNARVSVAPSSYPQSSSSRFRPRSPGYQASGPSEAIKALAPVYKVFVINAAQGIERGLFKKYQGINYDSPLVRHLAWEKMMPRDPKSPDYVERSTYMSGMVGEVIAIVQADKKNRRILDLISPYFLKTPNHSILAILSNRSEPAESGHSRRMARF